MYYESAKIEAKQKKLSLRELALKNGKAIRGYIVLEMEARNLNQYRMAKLCGMQVSEINQILDPERTPLLHNVLHICAALDIKLHPRQTPD